MKASTAHADRKMLHGGLSMFVCVLLAGLFGCTRGPVAWQRLSLNEPIASSDVAFIVDGVTRLDEVVDRLGPPDEMRPAGELVVARYHFTDGKYFRADFGWGLRFLMPFATPEGVLGGGGFGTDIFQIACDSRWVVQEHTFAWHTNSSTFRLWPFGD
jgi:hypothetical protein